jgi:hypothetical protein
VGANLTITPRPLTVTASPNTKPWELSENNLITSLVLDEAG